MENDTGIKRFIGSASSAACRSESRRSRPRSSAGGRADRRTQVFARILVICALQGVASISSVSRATAQDADVGVNLYGQVLDILTGTPIPRAAVYLQDEGQGVLADSLGVFRFQNVRPGRQLIAAYQFGYEETTLVAVLPEDSGAFIEMELTPQPILLDGVTAVVDNIKTMERRLQTRRRSTAMTTRAFDQERMLHTASANALEFLRWETPFRPVPCNGMASHCIIRRGRAINPRVYIDEIPVFGGLDQLETYPTSQIYLLEVYSSGAEIRAYTYGFMEQMARRPMALMPIGLWR